MTIRFNPGFSAQNYPAKNDSPVRKETNLFPSRTAPLNSAPKLEVSFSGLGNFFRNVGKSIEKAAVKLDEKICPILPAEQLIEKIIKDSKKNNGVGSPDTVYRTLIHGIRKGILKEKDIDYLAEKLPTDKRLNSALDDLRKFHLA